MVVGILSYFLPPEMHSILVYSFEIWSMSYITSTYLLKSVNCNFTLAVRSRKFGQAKTHFLYHHNCNVYYINRFDNFEKGTNGVMVSTIHFWSSDLLIVGSNPSLLIFFPNMRQKVSLGLFKFSWAYWQSKVTINWL